MAARVAGVLLVIIGVLWLAAGGFSYRQREKVVDAGPVQVSAERQHRVPISPLVGGLALVGGVILLLAGGDRRRNA